ncbi:MAG: hypothetical protein L3J74_09545 [Bacteroidales bacterium]|nr:hypothetical protein [Bacteroidales bacterium]
MSLTSFIKKKSNRKNIFLGILFIVVINVIVFPYFSSDTVNISSILDLRFGFSTDEVLTTLANMQEKGRKMYMFSTLLIDTPYAMIYGFIYAIIIAIFLKKIKGNLIYLLCQNRISPINRGLDHYPYLTK